MGRAGTATKAHSGLGRSSALVRPGWKAKAQTEQDLNKRLAYLERGLSANPDAETKGFLLLNKAAVLQEQGKPSEAKAILVSLAVDPTSPLDIEALAKYTLANLVEGVRR